MRTLFRILSATILLAVIWAGVVAPEDGSDRSLAQDVQPTVEVSDAAAPPADDSAGQPDSPPTPEPLPEEYSCMFCHGEDGTLAGDEEQKNLIVLEEDLATDIHWQKGLRCHDCHGGNPVLDDYVDHRDDDEFVSLASPKEVSESCGRCHGDADYMKQHQPALEVEHVQEYWDGVHGQHLTANEDPEAVEPATCLSCHSQTGKHDILSSKNPRSPIAPHNQIITCGGCHEEDVEKFKIGVHYESPSVVGASCSNCHGTHGIFEASDERSTLFPTQVIHTCGDCHANIEHMRTFQPSARTDQLAEYLTSGHGQQLQQWQKQRAEASDEEAAAMKAPRVATCVSCHHKENESPHEIRAIADLESSVYPKRVAETCKSCHADEELMKDYEFFDRVAGKNVPFGHDQYDLWKKSIHAKLLLEDGDLSAPTCNDCHGNHGALPPDVDSVANACGSCHVKVAGLFAETQMKHRFEEVDLPGCVTCHGNHFIKHPTDEMLGMDENQGVCGQCHGDGENQFGITLAGAGRGAKAAEQMAAGLRRLKKQISQAEKKLAEAERLGMEVRAAQFELRDANDALTNARSLVHGFAIKPMEEAIETGVGIGEKVEQKAQDALDQYTNRRIWLALFLLPILAVVVLLVLFIRSNPVSTQ